MIPVDAVRSDGEGAGGAGGAWLPPSSRLIRAVSKQIAAMRKELRMAVPVLGKEDLRRYRMYDAGSVLLELTAAGRPGEDWAARTLWQLLQLDGAARRELDAAAARALRRPPLARCPDLLHALALGLSHAGTAHHQGQRGEAGAHLLALAEAAWARGLAWWWLTERLFELAAEAAAGWRGDGGLCEASVALASGSFALYQLNECGESLGRLTLCAQLSAGQPWVASESLLRLLPGPGPATSPADSEGSMFRAASRVLCEALVKEARLASKDGDHGRASALCREAVQRAHDARSPPLELMAERVLGRCLLSGGQPQEAAAVFRTLLALAKQESPRHEVEAHLQIALCCHRQRDAEGALRSLRDARAAAEELEQTDLLARVHASLGEFFLNTTRPSYATAHFHDACHRYSALSSNKTDAKQQADRTRALAGLAGGLELWPLMVAALRGCDRDEPAAPRRERLLALLAWKDRRAPFWPAQGSSQDEVSIGSGLHVSQAVRNLHHPARYTAPSEEQSLQEDENAMNEK